MEDSLAFYPSSSLELHPVHQHHLDASSASSSSSSASCMQSMDIIDLRGLLHSLRAILESQEVSLFSICADDVSPSVRSHLQSVKMANMKAKDIAGFLSTMDQLPLTGLENTANSPVVRVVSMPSCSANSFRRSAPLSPSFSPPSPHPLHDSYSSAPSSPVFNTRSGPVVLHTTRKTPPPPIISNLSLSAPTLPAHSNAASPPPSPDMPRTKSKMNFFRRNTESTKLKHTQSVDLQPNKKRGGFSLFNTLRSPRSSDLSSTTPTSPRLHLSLDDQSMCKSLSLPSASAPTYSPLSSPTMQTSPSLTSSPSLPPSPSFTPRENLSPPASPSSKKQVYPILHEQSKLLFARKLETLRGSQASEAVL